MKDTLQFLEDSDNQPSVKPWRILIVDDVKDVHISTVFALRNKVVHGKPLDFLHVYSGKEASNLVAIDTNIDLMLLDAVMETPSAGVDCARYIRNELHRKIPIIIMRTGFAGWEVEMNIDNLSCIDDFILKSNASQKKIIDMLERWLPY